MLMKSCSESTDICWPVMSHWSMAVLERGIENCCRVQSNQLFTLPADHTRGSGRGRWIDRWMDRWRVWKKKVLDGVY